MDQQPNYWFWFCEIYIKDVICLCNVFYLLVYLQIIFLDFIFKIFISYIFIILFNKYKMKWRLPNLFAVDFFLLPK